MCAILPVSLDCLFLIAPSVFCVVFRFCFYSFCVLCPLLPVSLDCLFLITPSVFSSVYLRIIIKVVVVRYKFQQQFSFTGGRKWNIRWKPSTCCKSLTIFQVCSPTTTRNWFSNLSCNNQSFHPHMVGVLLLHIWLRQRSLLSVMTFILCNFFSIEPNLLANQLHLLDYFSRGNFIISSKIH